MPPASELHGAEQAAAGNGPTLWLNLQRHYDLEQAEREIDVSGIPTLEVA